jgi:pimeloyl-ACP methyl ester carboxylesterase
MSQTASTLVLRNLHEVFGESDAARRRAAFDEIFHEDAVFYEAHGTYPGRDNIDRIAGVIEATHQDFEYQPLSAPEAIGDGRRLRWGSRSPGKPPAYAGTDFVIAKPSWYLVSTDDRMIPPDAQRAMSKRAGSPVVEVEGSHAVYVSQPRAVADLIAQAANAVAVATQ